MPIPDDTVTINEIGRNLTDFRNEVRTALSQVVRTDVYRAEQVAVETRMAALEKARERDDQDRAAARRSTQGAIVAAFVSFVGSLLLVLLTR
jgi:hypothetical protein